MTMHFGEFPLIRTISYYATQGSVFRNVLSILSFLGGVTVFVALMCGDLRVMTASVPLVTALTLFISWPSLAYRVWFIVLGSAGVVVLFKYLSEARRLVTAGKNHGEAVLILWVPAVFLFFIVVADTINERYILLAVPALFLILFSNVGELRLILTLIPTAILALLLAYADYRFVNVNRDLVQHAVVPLQQQGFRVWSAAESGLRFYLEQQGIVTLSNRDVTPGPGDLIVRHRGLYGYSLAEPLSTSLISLKTFTVDVGFPVRIYSAPSGAGFHDSGAGLVPFTFSRLPYDSVEIAQVSPLLPAAVWSPGGPVFIQNEPEREFRVRMPSNVHVKYEREGDGEVVVN